MTQPTPPEQTTAEPTRRRKRWKKVLAWIGVVIVLLVPVGCVLRQRVHLYGNLWPDFNLRGREGQYRKIEESRVKSEGAVQPVSALDKLGELPSWPSFRGPNHDGRSPETGLITSWPAEGPRQLFRAPIGAGWAGFAVAYGSLYTIEQRRETEAVTCYDALTGKEIWTFTYAAAFDENLGGDGPRATPAIADGRVYALGAIGDLHCLDAFKGTEIWKANILKDTNSQNLTYGTASSPIVLDGKVYLTSTGHGGESLVAYDLLTGKLALKAFPEGQGYTSLVPTTLADQRQLVNVSGDKANGLDIETGKVIWSFPWVMSGGPNCAQPVIVPPDRVFLSSGYGKGCALVQIKSVDGKLTAGQLWANNKMKNKFNSSILHERHIYGLDEGVLACIDLANGGQKWKAGKYGHGQLIYADGKVIVMGEKGRLALVNASPTKYEEISSVDALSSKTWNHLALAGGILYVRNDREMVAYSLKP